MSILKKHVYYSIQSGCCAAVGSLFGKLSSVQITIIENILLQYIISAILIGCMLISNAAVWTFFVKALQETNTSFVPTLTVAATNYIFSAVAGWCVFGETLSPLWCLGTIMILSGLLLLALDTKEKNTEKVQ